MSIAYLGRRSVDAVGPLLSCERGRGAQNCLVMPIFYLLMRTKLLLCLPPLPTFVNHAHPTQTHTLQISRGPATNGCPFSRDSLHKLTGGIQTFFYLTQTASDSHFHSPEIIDRDQDVSQFAQRTIRELSVSHFINSHNLKLAPSNPPGRIKFQMADKEPCYSNRMDRLVS